MRAQGRLLGIWNFVDQGEHQRPNKLHTSFVGEGPLVTNGCMMIMLDVVRSPWMISALYILMISDPIDPMISSAGDGLGGKSRVGTGDTPIVT